MTNLTSWINLNSWKDWALENKAIFITIVSATIATLALMIFLLIANHKKKEKNREISIEYGKYVNAVDSYTGLQKEKDAIAVELKKLNAINTNDVVLNFDYNKEIESYCINFKGLNSISVINPKLNDEEMSKLQLSSYGLFDITCSKNRADDSLIGCLKDEEYEKLKSVDSDVADEGMNFGERSQALTEYIRKKITEKRAALENRHRDLEIKMSEIRALEVPRPYSLFKYISKEMFSCCHKSV